VKRRILTGDRPTGRLHLRHPVGSLLNRVKLQAEYDTIIIVADLHMLTTKPAPADIREIAENVRGVVLDYLAAGLDPGEGTRPSRRSMSSTRSCRNLVTVSRLSRAPSIKGRPRSLFHEMGHADDCLHGEDERDASARTVQLGGPDDFPQDGVDLFRPGDRQDDFLSGSIDMPEIFSCSWIPAPRPRSTVPPRAPALTDASRTLLPQPFRTMLTMREAFNMVMPLLPSPRRMGPCTTDGCVA
jgi:hypothetical protein